ncbi:MAG: ATP-binding protein [Tepidibacillus sp.]
MRYTKLRLDLSSKLWITLIIAFLISSLFNYWTTLYLYRHLYVEQTEKYLAEKGKKIVSRYTGGEISQSFKEKVNDINSLTNEEIVITDNPADLGACLPVDSEHAEPLVSYEQREKLSQGEVITIIGEHARFKRDIIAVAVPLIDPEINQLVGAVFLYMPLATVTEAVAEIRFLLFLFLVSFFFLGIIMGKFITSTMTKPLREMESVAKKMMDGDFEAKIQVYTEDEIGRLGRTFNHLSDSLKKTISLLSKEKKQLSQILDGISDSVLTIHKNEGFVLLNNPSKNLLRKLGLKKEEFIQLPEIKAYIERVKQEKDIVTGEFELHDKTYFLYLSPLIEVQELWGIILVIHDVTAERKRENDTREFLAIVSHELRTPLSYVRGYTEAIIDGVADSKETQAKYLETIHNETCRMERLVNDLLDLAQLEKSTYPMYLEEIRLDHIVNQVVERYLPAYIQKGVALQKHYSKPMWMIGDEDRIIQILVNLLDNALRHTKSGGKVTVEIYPYYDDIVLQVSDTGEGMEKEQLARIGEKFFRVDKARSRKSGGTGLGLAIVKQIIERLHGRLEVESTVDVGTTFRIYFPSISRSNHE